MTLGGRKATALLLLGDIAVFIVSLLLTLLVRSGAFPSLFILGPYVLPFGILFAFWILVFVMSGLYGKRTMLFKRDVPGTILRTQLFNVAAAAALFFSVPSFGITPKTTLLIYLAISLALIFTWRLELFPRISRPGQREKAALIGSGVEAEQLVAEVNGHNRYYMEFKLVRTPQDITADISKFEKELAEAHISLLVVDAEHKALQEALPRLYEMTLIERRYSFADFYRIYEEVFDRVPLSLLLPAWFLKHMRTPSLSLYSIVKRAIDFVGGIAMCLLTVVAMPFVFIAMRLEGPGPLFLRQERIGQDGRRMIVYKFRSMRFDKAASSEWTTEERQDNPITKVGGFLRKTSLDEFPQFLNVLSGELSLIGPRNDIEGLGMRLAEAIPYYNVRYIVKPGITGWAQINQQYEQGNVSPQSVEETKMRLAYDFYYIKNRSLALDLLIALRTVKRMLFRFSQ
jgi:lipopolysaccharide/colanic/teichoic acid biosynthesis glycosyltransferase